ADVGASVMLVDSHDHRDGTPLPSDPQISSIAHFLMGTDTTNMKFLIRDRAGQFTDAFDRVFADSGLHVLKSPPQAPKANAHCERVIGTLRRELLDRTLVLNEQDLRRILTRYLEHYNTARPHRGLGQVSPSQAETGPPTPIDLASHRVHRRTILGASSTSTMAPAEAIKNPQVRHRIMFMSPTGKSIRRS
ncbi:transposase, partial [Nonomuraea sp. NPDC049625]|uniref:integrase core domain-containing protein n=1 Tax=Nonomuraea sp. NPDC049625 TaxID=3155775 RepID=UPI003444A2DA